MIQVEFLEIQVEFLKKELPKADSGAWALVDSLSIQIASLKKVIACTEEKIAQWDKAESDRVFHASRIGLG
jgi:hypothetical protein